MQLELIPWLIDKTATKDPEDPPVRLSIELSIKVKDNYTGEVHTNKLPLELDRGEEFDRITRSTKTIRRLTEAATAFSLGRNGTEIKSVEKEEEQGDDTNTEERFRKLRKEG